VKKKGEPGFPDTIRDGIVKSAQSLDFSAAERHPVDGMSTGTRLHRRIPLLLLACMVALLSGCASPDLDVTNSRYRVEQEHMGTIWTITVYAGTVDEVDSQAAIAAAFQRVAELDRLLSDYSPDSELSGLSRHPAGTAIPVSPDTFAVIERALELSRATDGAFDPTVGPMVSLWRTARRSKILPESTAIESARARTGWQHVRLDRRAQTVTLLKDGLKLDLGAIAKGYAADAALRVLREKGCPRALVAASGDLALGDAPPGKPGWLIAVEAPGDSTGTNSIQVALKNCGVSTSGDVEQFVEIGGVRYSHIVDARTGLGLTNRVQATVVARDAATSDALATALCVMGASRGMEFAEKQRGVEAVIYEALPEGIRERRSRGFPTPKP